MILQTMTFLINRSIKNVVKVTYLGIRSAHERVWLVEEVIYCINKYKYGTRSKSGGEAGQHYPNL